MAAVGFVGQTQAASPADSSARSPMSAGSQSGMAPQGDPMTSQTQADVTSQTQAASPAGSTARPGSVSQANPGMTSQTQAATTSTSGSQAGMTSQSGNAPATDMSGGMSSKDVMALQQALQGQGENVKPDGVWGPSTQAALKHFQQQSGLPATGQLDQATRAKLNLQG